MVRPKRAPNNIKKALTAGSQSTTTELNLNDEDSVVMRKKSQETETTKSKANNKKTKIPNVINDDVLKEPRKRRMASLNAEFLVHYCSNTNPNLNQTPEKTTSQSPSSSKRRRTISNESKLKTTNPRRKIKKKDPASDENETEHEVETEKNTKKTQKKKINTKQKTKKNHADSDDDNSESSQEIIQNRSRRSKKSDNETNIVVATSTGRPKREASLRASAMIIQTNEIEKTRFQYYTTTQNPTATTTTTTPVNQTNTKKSDDSKPDAKNHNFQVPQTPPKNTSKTTLKNSKKSETNLKHVSTTTTLANSNVNLGRNESPDDEESSNDVLIVAEKNVSPSELVLTEELLLEHNKQFGSYSTGNGTFSSHTKEYINKWINELVAPDDKPFPEDVIPIDSFGTKILNDPQYLNVKSRQVPTPQSTKIISKPVTSQVVINKQNVNKEVSPKVTSPKPVATTPMTHKNETNNQVKQNDLDTKTDSTTVNPVNQNRLSNQYPFHLSFEQTAQAAGWSYAPPSTLPRPPSPIIRPEQLTWTNIHTGSESVNQLIAAAVGCSLANNPMHLLNSSQNVPKPMQLPAHFSNSINSKYPPKPAMIDPLKPPKISYLPNPEYFNSLPQDPSYMIPSYSKLKLKSEKLMDIRSHQQAAAAAAAAVAASSSLIHQMPPMINVENVNFYGTLDEQQKAAAACFFQQHQQQQQQQQDSCLNCLPNTAQSLSNQATTAAAAAAAAVAMNLAKILSSQPETNKSEHKKIQDLKKHTETESVVSISSNSSDIKVIKPDAKDEIKQEVKQEPEIKEEIKQEASLVNEEKMDINEDNDDNKSVSSSLSSSVHLVVDETSMIVNENLESQMNVESEASNEKEEIQNALNEKTDSNSNTNLNVESVVVNAPIESNSNMLESENTMDKFDKLWILNSEPLEKNSYFSIKNRVSNMVVNLNDCVLVERTNSKKETHLENENVYSELINESSNTNYSCDENECSISKTIESFAQVKSIKVDPSCDKIMLSVKMFLKPEQIKNEIKNLNESIKFEENELISYQEASEPEVLDAEVIKSKSIISDHTNYLKMKESDESSKESKNEKVYFYRYNYDINKKEINLIVQN
ncbi:unnamed protein product [Brachionus calyciflorus]|uniref:Uncharacterized protein n=1 Tax=Brachionus calyciflorus TaxID=104777 RepID=A0A813MAK3_9BILA|nr:unnamed protein product [Brachionus calyciflorus]